MNIFFLITAASRERQWDTVRHQPHGIRAVTPAGIHPHGSRKTFTASRSWRGIAKRLITQWVPLPNVTFRTDIPANTDLIYSWSKIPLRSKKPYIIELDNPYALTYYAPWALRLLRPFLRYWLKKARHIVYMSEACRASFKELFGDMTVPATVLYPYVARPHRQPASADKKPLRFLFVALDFRIKGGPELVEAWRRAALPHAELHVVSMTPADIQKEYAATPGLYFHTAMSREEVLTTQFPHADVFVYPTLFDSFGMVLLEALAHGLGIITTNLYATPELVRDTRNGILLSHPILAPRDIGGKKMVSPIEEHAENFLEKYLGPGMFYEKLCADLVTALTRSVQEHQAWREESRKLFNEKFAPEIWEKTMTEIAKNPSHSAI